MLIQHNEFPAKTRNQHHTGKVIQSNATQRPIPIRWPCRAKSTPAQSSDTPSGSVSGASTWPFRFSSSSSRHQPAPHRPRFDLRYCRLLVHGPLDPITGFFSVKLHHSCVTRDATRARTYVRMFNLDWHIISASIIVVVTKWRRSHHENERLRSDLGILTFCIGSFHFCTLIA